MMNGRKQERTDVPIGPRETNAVNPYQGGTGGAQVGVSGRGTPAHSNDGQPNPSGGK